MRDNSVGIAVMRKFACIWFVCAVLAAFATSGHAGAPDFEGEPYVPSEILVKFVPDTRDARKVAIRESLKAALLSKVASIGLEHWRLPDTLDVEKAIERLSRMPEIDYAEPNYLYRPQVVPNDPEFGLLWHLDNRGQVVNGQSGAAGADIAAPGAWDIQTGSPSVVIAVVDSGVAFDHPDIAENIWRNPGEIPENGLDDDRNGYVDDVHGWDFVNGDNNPSDYSRDLDGDGHGTHVAGIIAAEGSNGIGPIGVMWQAQVMPLQVFDLFEAGPDRSGFIQGMNIIEAIQYAIANGAKIINCSFVGDGFSRGQYDILKQAGDKGVLVVAAAGNEGVDIDEAPVYPAGYDLDSIISVAATDENDQLANYSNFGIRTIDVAAPGGSGAIPNVYSLTPPPRVVLFSDDFESGGDRWITNQNAPWFTEFDAEFGSRVMSESEEDTAPGSNSWIRTASAIDSRNTRGIIIRFATRYRLEENVDFLLVEVSSDGSRFSPIHTLTGFSPGIVEINLWGNDAPPGERFDLRFLLNRNQRENYDGVSIDNLVVTGIRWEFTGNPYGFKSGTSMAVPVVSGIAGLIFSQNPNLSPAEVRAVLLDSVDRIDGLEKRVFSGGRVNAARALQTVATGEIPEASDMPAASLQSDGDGDGGGCFISAAR